ncbi:MAG: MotA/TolQ/ExbB proton channel family protein [Alphaproteobacteria bacterium]|nr:MotA/TolQ/ExbB proton channel family protein [Alphaproteobacteria bacterium]
MQYEARKITKPRMFILRMLIFLAFVSIAVTILYKDLIDAFMSNPFLNGLIFFTILFGILFTIRQIMRLYPEIRWLNNLRIADPTIQSGRQPKLLAPMATMLGNQTGEVTLSTNSMRTLLDSIGARLDEAHEISRYITGLLVFLGLLGTFWGLLGTLNSIAGTISGLDAGAGEASAVFEELKAGLEAPLQGMATAFSSSLFGLAGSLVIGFMDIQANQAQNRFYLELEDWLSTVTDITDGSHEAPYGGSAATPQINFAIQDMQKSIAKMDNRMDEHVFNTMAGNEAINSIAEGVQHIAEQVRQEGENVRELVDHQNQQNAEMSSLLQRLQAQNPENAEYYQEQQNDQDYPPNDNERD